MANYDSDLKAKYLILVSIALAILLFASYYLSVLESEEATVETPQSIPSPIIQTEIPEPVAEPTLPEPLAEKPENQTQPKESNEITIEIKNFQFIPREVNITVGTTIVWKNLDVFMGDVRPHMVAANFNEFRSERLLINDTYYHTFDKIGKYTYRDAIFSTKMGTARINVRAKETSLITGNILGFNKDTAASGLVMLLMVIIIIALYNEKKLHLIVHHHNHKNK